MIKAAARRLTDAFFSAMGRSGVQSRVSIQSGGCGLFSDVFIAINSIQLMHKYGLSGRVHWGRRSLYYDPNRKGNAFNYFFSSKGFNFSNARLVLPATLKYFPSGDGFSGPAGLRPRDHLHGLMRSYAWPSASIMDEVESYAREHLSGGYTLGVHVRRTDAAASFESRRSQPVENFVEAASQLIAPFPEGRVFLATDAASVVDRFRERFGSRLLVREAIRSPDDRSIHGHHDAGIEGDPYQKGVEAMIDALVLARCNYLLRCFSFLTNYTLCVNPELKFTDLDKQVLGAVRTPWIHQ